MTHEMIDVTYRQTNLPNESPEYLAKREELRLAEIELLNTREKVAALRRALPKGATIQDYEFLEGPTSLDDGDAPTKKSTVERTFHYARSFARDLPLHVRKEADRTVSNVYRLDR
jgi:hypothetical protein